MTSATTHLSIAAVSGDGLADLGDRDLDRLELEASRRALALIKGKLGSKGLQELLTEELLDGDDREREGVGATTGDWEPVGFELDVKGLELGDWLDWIRANIYDESLQFAVHPEHYVWTSVSRIGEPDAPGDFVVVEPLGGHMMRGYGRFEDWDGMEAYFDPDYPTRVGIVGRLRDGRVSLRSIWHFRETEEGFRFRYQSLRPRAATQGTPDFDHAYLEYVRYLERAHAATRAA
jgi:hypothetical protein